MARNTKDLPDGNVFKSAVTPASVAQILNAQLQAYMDLSSAVANETLGENFISDTLYQISLKLDGIQDMMKSWLAIPDKQG